MFIQGARLLTPQIINVLPKSLSVWPVLLSLGLARLIEISVNRSIYKRKTIIDMKIHESVTFNGSSGNLFN